MIIKREIRGEFISLKFEIVTPDGISHSCASLHHHIVESIVASGISQIANSLKALEANYREDFKEVGK